MHLLHQIKSVVNTRIENTKKTNLYVIWYRENDEYTFIIFLKSSAIKFEAQKKFKILIEDKSIQKIHILAPDFSVSDKNKRQFLDILTCELHYKNQK